MKSPQRCSISRCIRWFEKRSRSAICRKNRSSTSCFWGIHAIGADISASASKDGKGVIIAVLDTGIANHADLKVLGGISLVGDEVSQNYVDDFRHGTHVAGTIAAQNNGIGIVGTADKADLYSVKVLDSEGSGSYEDVIEVLSGPFKSF